MKLGVCYYPEHWPVGRWPIDAQLMRRAGLSVVRIAEFAWAKMEPTDGRFEWGWLDQAIEILAKEGLEIVLCTPTATPPAWLIRAFPEILPVDSQGRRREFGSRRHYCANSPVYRQYTERIVTALARRYGEHPSVTGWQLDNEFGCHNTARCYCEQCAIYFRQWLQKRYHTLDTLNNAWGTIFWSQIYNDWEQIYPPIFLITQPNPSQVLDYYRFSSDSIRDYQQIQINILRKFIGKRFVNTNLMGDFSDLNYHELARPLDFVTWDSYPTGYAEIQADNFYLPGDERPSFAYDLGDPYVTGFCHDLIRGLKQCPFWVMEQQCGNINWSSYNTAVRKGAVRLWTWHALASGAETVVYFRWRACRFAQEQYHSGLLHHDASPDIGFQELCSMQEERDLMGAISCTPWEAQVAILMSYEDLWGIQLQPHHAAFGYLRHLFRYYRALMRLGIQVDIVSITADINHYRMLIAPTAFLVDERCAELLRRYVEDGGTILFGVRSGFKTGSNLVTDLPLPGLLRPMVGATVEQWHSLPPGIEYGISSNVPGLAGKASLWAEALQPSKEQTGKSDATRALAMYSSGPFKDYAALTEHQVGKGRVLYLGWYPGLSQVEAVITKLATQISLKGQMSVPEGLVTVRRGSYRIWLNFTEQDQRVTVGEDSFTVQARNLIVKSL